MSTNDTSQADLFGSIESDAGPSADSWSGIDPSPQLAIPCGFRNRHNAPCRRLGVRPVIIDSEPFHHRGCCVVYCDPACFRDEGGPGGDQAPGNWMGGSGGGGDRAAG